MVNIPKLHLATLRLGLLLALAPFLLLTMFNQPFLDDFRYANSTREHGLWAVQSWLYLTWTGRFTSSFMLTVLNPVTYGWLGGVKVVAAVFFVALWAGMAFFIRSLVHSAARAACSRSTAFWASGILLALFCNATASPFSFFYWFSGAVGYLVPLLALLAFCALAVRVGWGQESRPWRWAWLACGPLVLAMSGCELTLVQGVPVLALLGYALPRASRPKWWLWVAVGATAGALDVLAPGNWLRAGAMAPYDRLYAYRWLVLGPRSAYSAVLFLGQPMVLLTLVVAGGAGLWLGFQQRPHAQPLPMPSCWRAILLAFGVLNGAGFVLFRYLIVGPPLPRGQNEILLVMLISTAGLAWAAARNLPALAAWEPRFRRSGLAFGLLIAGLLAAGHVPRAWWELCTSAAPFDAQMQDRYARLRAAHRAGKAAAGLPALHLRYGHVLIPLQRFDPGVEFDVDLVAGCSSVHNWIVARYFKVPDACRLPLAEPAAKP
ncbi:hypothetical protein [Hymenobacter terricola]|uniref:hypothetical protein n=1 Tax=Hymenobacter terricola TaxID=2819236 RepID=UPI001B30A858|nr:hypothetical protein [Hymenobacter terricola]